jgi:glycosyltransferase involved in cell wall biosynthesis
VNPGPSSGAWLVVAAYNEALVIEDTLRAALRHFPNVVVVDDHSRDETFAIARMAGAHVCRHPLNLGQGAALQTGIDYALLQGATEVITFDADGQHRAVDAAAMLATLRAEGYDVILASRFRGEAIGMSGLKRLLLKSATLFTRITTGLALTDTHNGLRVLSRSSAERIRIRHNRMAHASEILQQIADLNLRYVEMPCTIIYTEYSKRKGQKMSGALTILKDLFVGKLHS